MQMNLSRSLIAALVASAVLASSPASAGVFGSDDNSSSIEKGQARSMNRVLKGVVLQVSDAKIEETKGAAATGVAAGAGIGGTAGGLNSRGGGSIIGSIVGAVVGGVAGGIAASAAGSQKAQDIIIQIESNGDVINITQAVDEKIGAFAEGDAVLVLYKGEAARVIRNKMAPKAPATAPTPQATAPVPTPANPAN